MAGGRLGQAVQALRLGRVSPHAGSPETPASQAAIEQAVVPIALPSGSGPVVRGERWGNYPDWVILLHEPGTDLDAWQSLPATIMAAGFAALALDLPGHGLTDGRWRPELLAPTVTAAVGYARAADARRVFFIGAGTSATVCLELAHGFAADGVVGLSPADPGEEREKPRGAIPTLVFAGAQARGATAAARRCIAGRGGWTMLSAIPTSNQGTRLLEGAWSRQVQEQIIGFLRQCRHGRERGGRMSSPVQ